MPDKEYYVYLMASKSKTLYVGFTNDLRRRIGEHKEKIILGFTQKYNITKLVYFEQFSDANYAISREKEIKKWRREKKIRLIQKMNPEFNDLAKDLFW